jgi:hypothetical protein
MRKDAVQVFVNVTASASDQVSEIVEVRDESRTNSIQSIIEGTGAVSATVNWYGSNVKDTSTGELIGINALSGTTKDSSGGGDNSVQWAYVWAVIPANSITGTGAVVNSYFGN